jgi:hypothetical protein
MVPTVVFTSFICLLFGHASGMHIQPDQILTASSAGQTSVLSLAMPPQDIDSAQEVNTPRLPFL